MVAVRGRLTARKFFILAGEPSGDSLAAGLISELMRKEPGARFRGVGGRLMCELGLEAIFPIGDISVMGIGEVLPRIPRLLARMKQAAAEVLEFEPDALITVDSPDFNFRVARKVKKIRPRPSRRALCLARPFGLGGRAGRPSLGRPSTTCLHSFRSSPSIFIPPGSGAPSSDIPQLRLKCRQSRTLLHCAGI